MRRDGSVNIATGYRLSNWGSMPSPVARFFFPPQHPDWMYGPPSVLIQWVLRAISPEVKRPEHEADNSHQSSVKVKSYFIIICYASEDE
jgi:hypothetical protein